MRKLTTEKRAAILSALCEGNSINATARMNRVSKITVLRLLADAGLFPAVVPFDPLAAAEAAVAFDEMGEFR